MAAAAVALVSMTACTSSSGRDPVTENAVAQAEDEAAGRDLSKGRSLRRDASLRGRGTCDRSYPTTCIPPGPPDLDCDDVEAESFTVRSPDPHEFDRDGDGVGCEPQP